MGAPRMTRRDRWAKRPVVLRYFEFKDTLIKHVGRHAAPDELHATAYVPMPDSWSQKKKKAMDGMPHRVRFDGDNCLKAIQDSLFHEDGAIWFASIKKLWCKAGQERIELTLNYHEAKYS